MACQILEFLPFFTSSRPPFLFSSILPFFLCFWDLSGAYCGVRQGGFQGDVPRADLPHTSFQLRLKIALVFDPVFLRFWLHLGCQDDPQNPRKSFKNQLRKCTPTSKPLRSDFLLIFLRFSTPPLGKQKSR